MEAETAIMAGHCAKDWPWQQVRTANWKGDRSRSMTVKRKSLKVKPPGKGSDDPMGQTARMEEHQNVDRPQQMTLLCQTVQNVGKQMQDVQNLGKQMQDGFALKSQKTGRL